MVGLCALAAARDRRAPLDLDLPERKILLDATGPGRARDAPERLEAHRLIEEFMIQANVAAAETLEAKRAPVVYRVHDAPSKEKLAALREFLDSLGLKLPGAATLRAGDFNKRAASGPSRCPPPTSSTRSCCARRRRPSMPPTTSATSA